MQGRGGIKNLQENLRRTFPAASFQTAPEDSRVLTVNSTVLAWREKQKHSLQTILTENHDMLKKWASEHSDAEKHETYRYRVFLMNHELTAEFRHISGYLEASDELLLDWGDILPHERLAAFHVLNVLQAQTEEYLPLICLHDDFDETTDSADVSL